MAGEGKVVCVTGGSGYIASWLIKLLLQRGYTVKATVRNPDDLRKTEHLLSLEGAKERLHLLRANLLEEGSFDSAVDGCDGVFHTASPVSLTANDPQAELIEPAVNGTLNVLRACAKSHTIKRVVITSSMASMNHNYRPLNADVVVDETWFSDPDYCREKKLWYMLSKTLAEEAARKFAKDNELDMITIHPGLVVGPILQAEVSFSAGIILNAINGSEKYPDSTLRCVDVRDVANAHILAFEVSSASGRYCLVEKLVHFSDILMILHHHYPTLQLPQECVEDKVMRPIYFKVSKERANGLGINFIPLEVMLIDMVESFKEKGLIFI